MGEIAFACAVSHAPGSTGWPDKADRTMRDNIHEAYATLGQRLLASELDALLVIGNDHILNFPVTNYPDFCFGLAEFHEGPAEWFQPWLRVPEYRLPGAPEIGGRIYRHLVSNGAKTAASGDLLYDDQLSVPVTNRPRRTRICLTRMYSGVVPRILALGIQRSS